MARTAPFLAVASMAVLLAGCEIATTDPFDQPGTWRPIGANDHNLRAMVANPNDLAAGYGERGSSSIMANAAATRYYTDKLKQLPKSAAIGLAGGDGSGGGGGGTTTGLGASSGGNQ